MTRSERDGQLAIIRCRHCSKAVRSSLNNTTHDTTSFLTRLPMSEPGAVNVRWSHARLSTERMMTSPYSKFMPAFRQCLQTPTTVRLISYSCLKIESGLSTMHCSTVVEDGSACLNMIRRISTGGWGFRFRIIGDLILHISSNELLEMLMLTGQAVAIVRTTIFSAITACLCHIHGKHNQIHRKSRNGNSRVILGFFQLRLVTTRYISVNTSIRNVSIVFLLHISEFNNTNVIVTAWIRTHHVRVDPVRKVRTHRRK
jgi:hypothetical protein